MGVDVTFTIYELAYSVDQHSGPRGGKDVPDDGGCKPGSPFSDAYVTGTGSHRVTETEKDGCQSDLQRFGRARGRE